MSGVFNLNLILLAPLHKPSVSFTFETSRRTSGAERGRVDDGWQAEEKKNPKTNKTKEVAIYTMDLSFKGRDEPAWALQEAQTGARAVRYIRGTMSHELL